MKEIKAIIEHNSDGSYNIYCVDEMFSGIGDTVESAKENMRNQINFYIETCKKDNHPYPKWLDEEYKIIYIDFINK